MTLRLRLQNSSLPYLTAQDNPAAFHPSSAERWLTLLYLPVLNFFLLLVPSPLTYDWQMGTVPMIGMRHHSQWEIISKCSVFHITWLRFLVLHSKEIWRSHFTLFFYFSKKCLNCFDVEVKWLNSPLKKKRNIRTLDVFNEISRTHLFYGKLSIVQLFCC